MDKRIDTLIKRLNNVGRTASGGLERCEFFSGMRAGIYACIKELILIEGSKASLINEVLSEISDDTKDVMGGDW